MKRTEEYFVALWCTVMPITNFVVIPAIPGSLPAYLLALVSLAFVAKRILGGSLDARLHGYMKMLAMAGLLWSLLFVGSQFGHILNNRTDFSGASLVTPTDTAVLFRVELFTQSMYLFACILIALYFRFVFRPHMMRYVYWGAYLMAAYGIYEWLFFLVFKQPGDFLGNRVYGMGTEDTHTGSWSQSINIVGLELLRIKSTFGEPSFFSAAVIPYFFLALDNRKLLLASLCFFTALFSTSTTCYLALAACFIIRSFWLLKRIGPALVVPLIFGGAIYAMAVVAPDTFADLFGSKFSGDTDSGHSHLDSLDNLETLLGTFSPLNWIFGMGVGSIYAGVTLAVFFNTGLIGLAIYLVLFLKPVVKLNTRDAMALGLKSGVLSIFLAYTINVAEFYLPTTWMFIGLTYWKLDHDRRAHVFVPSSQAEIPSIPPSSETSSHEHARIQS